ncbi:ATP-binding protein [Uliginosibacterium paludis]|uniref:histidine kinase n=1 Tax=Uliginosibacterium paludis TaxID=1615952 RepID=A0ABV2CP68_9RHOO
MSGRTSIRKRILVIVGLGVALTGLLQVMIAYRVALSEVDAIADFHMVEMARAVRRAMPETSTSIVPAPGSAALPASEENCFTLRVQRVDFPAVLTDMDKRGHRHFAMRREGTQLLRVLYVEAPGIHIEVSHDMAIRARTARDLAFRTTLPILGVVPLLLLIIWFGTTQALRPLRHTRNEIARRKADDLKPLSTQRVPTEALPFVEEINTLFTRINREFEARQNFVADVAHELRSPLAALSLQVKCLQRAQSPEARQQASERVMAGITRATRLVEQLLVLAREGAAQPVTSVITLPQVARLAMSDMLTHAQARQIDLGADFQEQLPEVVFTVRGDVEALRVLLRNLLDNAVKYTPQGGVVNLSLLREPDAIVLRIEDSGPGIPETERDRLFERFQRGSSGLDTGGSGLGLAIVRTIAANHGITLSMDQSATLGGLAVSLRFPPLEGPKASAA